ncbi:MAG TPA: SOS response-associated peptidase [Planctomycetota bacterium]
MCGRFTLHTGGAAIARAFELAVEPALRPRFNVAPTQDVAAVRVEAGQRRLRMLHWGLLPAWAKDRAMAARMINARSETVAEKPAYRSAFRRRRCLVPADGFYEWRKLEGTGSRPRKEPWLFTLRTGGPFAIAGLWEQWRDPAGAPDAPLLESCTLLTTEANSRVAPVHLRMPVILPQEHWAPWLDPALDEPQRLLEMLLPFAAGEMDAWPVSRLVNNARHDAADCLDPVPPERGAAGA